MGSGDPTSLSSNGVKDPRYFVILNRVKDPHYFVILNRVKDPQLHFHGCGRNKLPCLTALSLSKGLVSDTSEEKLKA